MTNERRKNTDREVLFARKVPFSPKAINYIVRELPEILMEALGPVVVEGAVFEKLVGLLIQVLHLKGCPEDAVRRSVQSVLGRRLSPLDCRTIALRLAGNKDVLALGRAVGPWRKQQNGEWVPVLIENVSRAEDGTANLRLLLCAGRPAGIVTMVRWPLRRCAFHATHDIGFSRSRPNGMNPEKYPYAMPTELLNMWFLGLVDSKLSETEPVISRVSSTSSLRAMNQKLLKYRTRVSKEFSCPLKQRISLPCYKCPAGLDRCQAACRKISLPGTKQG